ncbi:MAG: PLP-dependent transferase [Daejeonella sp.]|uniref:PLP-dependent transferase n=1 Tax=Daejeonella sp. TaxID=2805397 RepID=UPI002732DAF6|nr:PLP-dependent transferase [Daejeonella sp.]MDP3469414.1 PLP-dependent transferase [Daejeonella sp.]
MKRRDVIKGLTMLPLAGGIVGSAQAAINAEGAGMIGMLGGENSAAGPMKFGPEVYRSLGVEPVINCRGTFTIIGASTLVPEAKEAMYNAQSNYVQLDELAMGVGKRLAELSGAEWGVVSCGCAGGMKIVTMAAVTGGNPEKLVRIPDLTGFEKDEVIIPRRSRNTYDHAVRNVGVKIITVDTQEELEAAMNPRTAMIYMMPSTKPGDTGPLSVHAISKAAKLKGIPVLVDAAAEALTLNPNVHLADGATIVAYSGGKAIRGPQSAGLLLGDKKLLMAAWQASAPHHGAGRDNKVGKEEQIGMLAAVEAWTKRNHAQEELTWTGYLETISKRVSAINGVTTSIRQPTGLDNRTPTLTISWDPAKFNASGQEMATYLSTTKPRIALSAGGGRRGTPASENLTSISVAAFMMQPGDDKIVADRIFNALNMKRPVTPEMKAPSADLKGRWDVTIEYFNEISKHAFSIEQQDSNWLKGSHKSAFTTNELEGTIDGNEVIFRSASRMIADNVPFTFSGTVSGDTMSGNIHHGEYLTSKFTAKKIVQPSSRQRIHVPVGPPLSS